MCIDGVNAADESKESNNNNYKEYKNNNNNIDFIDDEDDNHHYSHNQLIQLKKSGTTPTTTTTTTATIKQQKEEDTFTNWFRGKVLTTSGTNHPFQLPRLSSSLGGIFQNRNTFDCSSSSPSSGSFGNLLGDSDCLDPPFQLSSSSSSSTMSITGPVITTTNNDDHWKGRGVCLSCGNHLVPHIMGMGKVEDLTIDDDDNDTTIPTTTTTKRQQPFNLPNNNNNNICRIRRRSLNNHPLEQQHQENNNNNSLLKLERRIKSIGWIIFRMMTAPILLITVIPFMIALVGFTVFSLLSISTLCLMVVFSAPLIIASYIILLYIISFLYDGDIQSANTIFFNILFSTISLVNNISKTIYNLLF
ncbi:hypothetical protein DFA_11126 [Cavenderia fasciculata]|uniref:Uncharacterized protein n=1 Tax=Cavenderia fasciculata TaxID=261658 RepID=F4QF06_CACFS|nr:uncharacterized protein DFA_11126 [Cavenderia fasciculata]EGG13365.1 hypothetical protein DFA_11126 [Cavenderia fasciculata]|eukprot:XP_004350069.1 hypothetical protein DFA_11126 [Cavenderia fasciculata]